MRPRILGAVAGLAVGALLLSTHAAADPWSRRREAGADEPRRIPDARRSAERMDPREGAGGLRPGPAPAGASTELGRAHGQLGVTRAERQLESLVPAVYVPSGITGSAVIQGGLTLDGVTAEQLLGQNGSAPWTGLD
jgi:hypothetical protein